MAVVAFGSNRAAQLEHFAVEGLEISLRYAWVASAALIEDALLKTFRVGPDDGMGLMTSCAIGQFLLGRRKSIGVNAGFERFIDTGMTSATGLGDMLMTDARLGVVLGQDMMGRVAIRTHGCDDQTALEESFSMDAQGIVVGIDIFAASGATGCSLSSGAMAPAAKSGHIGGERRGL